MAPVVWTLVLVGGATTQEVTRTGNLVTVRAAAGFFLEQEWAGDRWLENVVELLSAVGGGTISFSPGTYEFGRGLRVAHVSNVHFQGAPGTVFRLRKAPEIGRIRLTSRVPVDNWCLEVDRPELVRERSYYRVFRGNLDGYRILELETDAVEGHRVGIRRSNSPQVEELEPGMLLVPALNFFYGWRCSDISFTGIHFDGNAEVREVLVEGRTFKGHTTHCGILLMNPYLVAPGEPGPPPPAMGLAVRNCRFTGLLGRGIAAYNIRDVTITGCRFGGIGAEAVEIDHRSREVVVSQCHVTDAMIGLRLNDCNGVTVGLNTFNDCGVGIFLGRTLHDDTLNKRITVTGNTFSGGTRAIVCGPDTGDTTITGNLITGPALAGIELAGTRLVCTGNVLTGCVVDGIRVLGKDCVVQDNLVELVAPASPESRPATGSRPASDSRPMPGSEPATGSRSTEKDGG